MLKKTNFTNRRIKYIACIVITLVLSAPATAQTGEPTSIKECRITGTLESPNKANAWVYYYLNGQLHATQADQTGFFSFTIPRNTRIGSSNVEQLNQKKCRGKCVDLKHARFDEFWGVGIDF